MEIAFWVSLALIAYVYVGYPLLLLLVNALVRPKPVAAAEITPKTTLIVSAFNEEDVIGDKIRNSLALDYPMDALEIVIVSDASDDDTDAIVQAFPEENVKLLRMEDRGGKTLGLNAAVAAATGEIVVFSDANAMYDAKAMRFLVGNFADPAVGAVVGESTYEAPENDADQSESSYWQYEIGIKRLETRLGSVVGGDGAIYAIRRELYRPMPADALSDFVNPLQIVDQGYRCVYEPRAFSVEESAGQFDKEFRRKVRIVNRAWRATMRMRSMLNPFAHGFFALKFWSHKLLRWLVPLFLLVLLIASAAIATRHPVYLAALAGQLLFYSLALIGALARRRYNLPFFVSVPYYFCLVNIAGLKGIAEYYLGKSYTTWATPRTN